MTDKMKVYSKVLKTLKQMMPTAEQNQIVVLAMMVAGIVSGRKAQLAQMGLHVPDSAKPESRTMRFRRFVKNERVDTTCVFMPFAEQILAHLSTHRLFLTMDASQVGRGCMTLVVAVIYRQRAIPLAWIVYEGKKGHTVAARHIEVLQLVKSLIPEEVDVVLLADAEYDTVEMLQWVDAETEWAFVIRTSPTILITELDRKYPISDLLSGQYGCVAVADVSFTAKEFGPVMVAAWWAKPHKKPVYLLSNHPCLQDMCNFYQKRFKIETMFSDKKSRGFNIHKSHLKHPERLARLLLAVALAYIWMVYMGVEVAEDEDRRSMIDRTDRTDKSLFRLGLDWLAHALTNGLPFDAFFAPL